MTSNRREPAAVGFRLAFTFLLLPLLVDNHVGAFSSPGARSRHVHGTWVVPSIPRSDARRAGHRTLIKTPPRTVLSETVQNDDSVPKKETGNDSPPPSSTKDSEFTSTTVDGADALLGPPDQPTVADYRKFALPCLGLWIAQPLLSLVDTAFVGLSSDPTLSATQLAALGPATTFVDGATYLFAFLNVASTGLYSAALAQHGSESDSAENTVRTAAKIGLRCGIGVMFFLLAFARPLMALYIGPEAASTPGLLDAATEYVRIRSFSMPTSLLLGVVQACLLGAKDSVTPLIAILYCTIINTVGDFLLVGQFRMGLRGAAIATTLAQWAATYALLGPARKRLLRDRNLRVWGGRRRKGEPTASGRSFLGYAAPVLTLILGKIAAFGFMTHSAAAVPGQPTPLAAHQIVLSLFFFVSPFMEVISQTAQTFLPPFLVPLQNYVSKRRASDPSFSEEEDESVQVWNKSTARVSASLLKMGISVAVVVASLASFIPAFGGSTLTPDTVVQGALKPLAKYLLLGSLLAAPVAVSEGILLARRELKFLASVYLATTAVLPAALLQIKKVGGTAEQIWGCFAVFQLTRAVAFVGRIWAPPILRRFFGKNLDQRQQSGQVAGTG